jgi:hypothetical protein
VRESLHLWDDCEGPPWPGAFLFGVPAKPGNPGERLRLQNVADWISHNTMLVRVDEIVPPVSVARVFSDHRQGAAMFLNAGLDANPEAFVHLRLPIRWARLLAINQEERTMEG